MTVPDKGVPLSASSTSTYSFLSLDCKELGPQPVNTEVMNQMKELIRVKK